LTGPWSGMVERRFGDDLRAGMKQEADALKQAAEGR
jgi:hypothetical protein